MSSRPRTAHVGIPHMIKPLAELRLIVRVRLFRLATLVLLR